ncbi:sugar phosphate isomerase/epimerase [Pedobacter heparinus]|uniref:sugar phosphate isomerase/epimerase family protein n=1 Tax=Pedobacter heparinus TaxID=984 RepID=UPI00292F784B|nr:sugar phosphate isomerase/epimerase [Pedobacter heparinus]
MRILYFCTTWGQRTGSWDDFFNRIIAQGYHGVETDLPAAAERDEFMDGLNKYGLKFIAQHWETTDTALGVHGQKYEDRLRQLAVLKPLFINSHTGRDFFTYAQNIKLLDIAERVAQDTGVQVVHETHRSRFAYAAHVTLPYLQERSALQLTLDISHWCAVAETLLQDQQEAVDLAIKHTRHIHARVGFEQGPQVADPSLPVYREALDFHLSCWDKVLANANHEFLTITPEFGPVPYMPPDQPDDQQWQNNLYLMNLLKNRYQLNPS